MRSDVERDITWQAPYMREAISIVGRELAPHLFTVAPPEPDLEENTDLLVLRARDIRVACRMRRKELYWLSYPFDVTFRATRTNGAQTEMEKMMAGWGHAFLYGFVGNGIEYWSLLSLNKLRGFLTQINRSKPFWTPDDLVIFARDRGIRCGHIANHDNATTFVHFDRRDLAAIIPNIIIAKAPQQ
jgi:hypothetical protein